MFDTMTFTKILGGFCGTFLVFLLGKYAAENVYATKVEAHGDGEVVQGFLIETASDDTAEPEETGPTFEEVFASAEADRGERVFNQCRACHALEEGVNGAGPYLYNVVGRDIGVAQGYSYSGALSEAADVWTPEHLNAFLEDPQGWAPGTSMGYSGLRDVEDRANLIAYLETFGG